MIRFLTYLILAVLMLASISCSEYHTARKKNKQKSDLHNRHVRTTKLHSSGIPVKVVRDN
jgi:hypothetical protein